MAQPTQQRSDENTRTECIVATILTVSALGTGGSGIDTLAVSKRYAEVLKQLRNTGSFLNPRP